MAATMNRYWGPGGKNQWDIYRDHHRIADMGLSKDLKEPGYFLVSHNRHQNIHYNWDIDIPRQT